MSLQIDREQSLSACPIIGWWHENTAVKLIQSSPLYSEPHCSGPILTLPVGWGVTMGPNQSIVAVPAGQF